MKNWETERKTCEGYACEKRTNGSGSLKYFYSPRNQRRVDGRKTQEDSATAAAEATPAKYANHFCSSYLQTDGSLPLSIFISLLPEQDRPKLIFFSRGFSVLSFSLFFPPLSREIDPFTITACLCVWVCVRAAKAVCRRHWLRASYSRLHVGWLAGWSRPNNKTAVRLAKICCLHVVVQVGCQSKLGGRSFNTYYKQT